MRELLQHPDLWKYVSIPFVAAVVGWATNWVAVRMTFYPTRFWGIPPWLGWQGIIPAKAEKMATIFVDSTMSRLGRLSEIYDYMEPEVIARHVATVIEPRLDLYTDEVIQRANAVLWENLPGLMKNRVYAAVRAEMPALMASLVHAVGRRIEELTDLKNLIINRFRRDPQLLNRLFLEAGDAEFRFIVRSGFYFGFLFGLIQLLVWIFHPAWWVLPAFGGFVGYATNWLAINMIFRPLRPRKVGPFVVQGLFLRRQAEVATVWCGLVTREIVTLETLVREMLTGPHREETRELIRRALEPIADRAVEQARPFARLAVGPRGFRAIKSTIGEKAVQVSEDPFTDPVFVADRGRLMKELLVERMVSMPPEQFQDLLRPCFQEDEWKLILLGAVLGLLAGTAQLLFVFGGA